ncbi:MAG: hypothetical protein HYT87_04640 [Nitrospirae bacterium]|nr:hypothetical protein [Nitrospirota bacterium]
MKHITLLLLFLSAAITTNCGGIIVKNLRKAGLVAQRNPDPMLIKYGAPSNLLLFEGLADTFSDNADLMSIIAQTYCSYAMGFVQDDEPERAMVLFMRGRDFGLRSLLLTSPFKKAVRAAAGKKPANQAEAIEQAVEHLEKGVDAIKDKKLVERLFWTGNCWAGWLNLAKKDPLALFDIPKVLSLMNRSKDLDDQYFYGGVHAFFGAYYAGLPSIAGGGVEKSQKEFDIAFGLSNKKLLLPYVLYAEQFATLIKDEALFDKVLQEVLDTPSDTVPEMTVANEIAKLKAKRLISKKNELF